MTARVWTHPEHCKVAILATMLNIASLLFCILAFMVVNWFSNNRYAEKQAYKIFNQDVDCSADICSRASSGDIAEWQKTAFNLIVAGLANNIITTMILVCLFWPLVIFKNKVVNVLLVVCRVMDFVGAYFKVAGACIYMSHSHAISKIYVRRTHPFSLKLEFEPLALLLISFLAEMVCFVLLVVATDKAPRTGGPTHRERLDLDTPPQKSEEVTSEKRVSYMPDRKESHSRVLSQLELEKNSRKSWKSSQLEGSQL